MDPGALLADFRSSIVGHEVRFRRLATNSLLVYIDNEPGDDVGLTLWFEPTWHLRDQTRVLTGSRQAQHDEEAEDPDAGFRLAAAAVDLLVGTTVSTLDIDPVTRDLRLDTTSGLTLCTFISDPASDHFWRIRDNATRVALYCGVDGLEITPPGV
jgi:hypothetical protein